MCKTLIFALAATVAVLTSVAQAQTGPQNLDFERGKEGGIPPGWFMPTKGYTAGLSTKGPKQGSQCAHLSASSSGARAPFGNLMQTFDAHASRGKVVRFRAAVRTKVTGPSDQAAMWMRVDRTGKRMGFFDNMSDRPIRDGQWRYYEIVGDIDADALRINIGLMIQGEAQAWLDDVSFDIVAKATPVEIEPPRPLAGRGLANLAALARLLGYVRYFHPSDEAAEADWDAFAISGVRAVERAKNPQELASTLAELLGPMAPSVAVFETGRPPQIADTAPPHGGSADGLRLASWRHHGLGISPPGQSIYWSERVFEDVRSTEVSQGAPDVLGVHTANLGGGVSCRVPLSVYADREGTIPNAPATVGPTIEAPPRRYTGDDRTTRLAAVMLCWNVMQHFYPYFDVVDTDWGHELERALTAAATDKDEEAFLKTIQRMVAALQDGHGTVRLGDGERFSIPLGWAWVEGHVVVTRVDPESSAYADGVRPGTIVHVIDGLPATGALAEVEQLVSAATPQFRRWMGLRRLAVGPEGESVALGIEDPTGGWRPVTVRRTVPDHGFAARSGGVVNEVEPGIFYLDFNRITNEQFTEALPKLASAKGIVFDFRGYPRGIGPDTYFPHIIDAPVVSPQWHTPVVWRPDRANLEFVRGGEWHLSPSEPYLKAKKVFIIDGRCISYAESCLGIIEHYKLGELVGEATAGTNGNTNPFTLPGGYRVNWTGMKVLKHDGSRHHGIGIIPTIPVSRTIKGVTAGRDEFLDKAMEIVRGG